MHGLVHDPNQPVVSFWITVPARGVEVVVHDGRGRRDRLLRAGAAEHLWRVVLKLFGPVTRPQDPTGLLDTPEKIRAELTI